jgi:hypothetical protein
MPAFSWAGRPRHIEKAKLVLGLFFVAQFYYWTVIVTVCWGAEYVPDVAVMTTG